MQMTCLEREYLARERQQSMRQDIVQSRHAARSWHSQRPALRDRAAVALLAAALRLSPGVVDLRHADRATRPAGCNSFARA